MSDALTLAEQETLREMRSYDYYAFRQATAKKLVARGYAEVVPGDENKVRPGHRITEAGRESLRANP
jgi:hypothetical protein